MTFTISACWIGSFDYISSSNLLSNSLYPSQTPTHHPVSKSLQLIIGGLGKIDLADWKTNTRLKHCTSESNVVRWFWQAVEAFSEERRGRLLQFVTGSTRVPLQGFKALQGGSCTGTNTTYTFWLHFASAIPLMVTFSSLFQHITHIQGL